jgi:taurine dioxygenase
VKVADLPRSILTGELIMTLSIRPLGNALGAEVTGFDLKRDLNATTIEDINRAWAEYVVLCFRDQDLSPGEFVRLARLFGEPVKQVVKQKEYSLQDFPEVGIVSSEQRDPMTGERIYRGGSWHTDHSHIAIPPRGTMLYALQIPPQGGDTRFTNQRAAYRALSDEMKDKIDDLRAVHVYLSKYSPRKMPTRTKEEEALSPGTSQPLVRHHPPTGEKAIYLNPIRTESIEGMPEAEAQDLLNTLLEHSTQPCFQYAHQWRLHDVVIWDNRCALHAATFDYDFSTERRMHRIMIEGEQPY